MTEPAPDLNPIPDHHTPWSKSLGGQLVDLLEVAA